ncbi:hypothetical protein MSAN_02030600 [Mycena sanguinolenta]|uniref:Uncharacterized protein n=1 Tax=Mycena sanguinolenta TaxID=230812 RepID=A0A8H6XHS4_9AGAR|nr:hypothetical protein MSAN_02030600 [Mycena sanguinolenta]
MRPTFPQRLRPARHVLRPVPADFHHVSTQGPSADGVYNPVLVFAECPRDWKREQRDDESEADCLALDSHAGRPPPPHDNAAPQRGIGTECRSSIWCSEPHALRLHLWLNTGANEDDGGGGGYLSSPAESETVVGCRLPWSGFGSE